MPPLVTAFNEVYRVSGSLQNKNVLDNRAVLDSIICKLLDGDGLAAATALVSGDDNTRLAIVDAVAERL